MKSSVKILLVGALTLFCASEALADTLNDSRDGKSYKTVRIGEQTWMAENLNYETEQSVCYKNDPTNCEKYGRLYAWYATENVCPAGWRLPSKEELEVLSKFVGFRGESSDDSGFSTLLAGNSYSKLRKFSDLDKKTSFWSSTEKDSNNSFSLDIDRNSSEVSGHGKASGYSVRCIKD